MQRSPHSAYGHDINKTTSAQEKKKLCNMLNYDSKIFRSFLIISSSGSNSPADDMTVQKKEDKNTHTHKTKTQTIRRETKPPRFCNESEEKGGQQILTYIPRQGKKSMRRIHTRNNKSPSAIARTRQSRPTNPMHEHHHRNNSWPIPYPGPFSSTWTHHPSTSVNPHLKMRKET